jgi:putative transcriptional regulator
MRRSTSKQPAVKRLGQRITDSLTEGLELLRSGKALDKHLRVDVIEIPDPPRWSGSDVRELRRRLGLTQGIFARLLGVSVELVEHWEQGVRAPRPMACRLMHEIAHDPGGFLKRLRRAA